MFKQRLKELGKTILTIPLIVGAIALWTWVCILLHVEVLFDFLRAHNQLAMGLISIFFILTLLYMFVNWLFIEPYKAWRKSKDIK